MKRYHYYLILAISLVCLQFIFCPMLKAGDEILSIFKKADGTIGYHLVDMTNGKVRPLPNDVAKGVYIDQSLLSGAPGVPTPTPGDTPTLNPTSENAYNLAASIGSKQDAAILAAVYQKFSEVIRDGVLSAEMVRDKFNFARNLTTSDLTGKWKNAFASLDKEMEKATDLEQWLHDTAKGFSSYAGVAVPASLLEESNDLPEEINITLILTIIQAIMELIDIIKDLDLATEEVSMIKNELELQLSAWFVDRRKVVML